MHLNTLQPAPGAKKSAKRRGRGIGSGLGKTAGRGHKGQKSRTGGSIKPGFEGGQMPYQRRVPKMGFTSRKSLTNAEVRLHELLKVKGEADITLDGLKAAGIVDKSIRNVKVIDSGELTQAISLEEGNGIKVTKGARQKITVVGGKITTASAA